MNVIQMINNDAKASLNKVTPIIVTSINPLSPSNVGVLLQVLDDFKYRLGQYLEFDIDGNKYKLSIMNRPNKNTIQLLIGGSSLSFHQALLIDFFTLNQGNEISNYEVKGSATVRSINTHDVMFITSGSGISHSFSMIMEHLSSISQLDSIDHRLDIIWGVKMLHQMSIGRVIQDAVNSIDNELVNYHPLVEVVPSYQKGLLTQLGINKSTIIDQLVLNLKNSDKDLSKTIIYISGSPEFYKSVIEILSDYNYNPQMIVSDHKI